MSLWPFPAECDPGQEPLTEGDYVVVIENSSMFGPRTRAVSVFGIARWEGVPAADLVDAAVDLVPPGFVVSDRVWPDLRRRMLARCRDKALRGTA